MSSPSACLDSLHTWTTGSPGGSRGLQWGGTQSPLEKQSQRYLEAYGAGRSDEFKRRVVGEGWVERWMAGLGVDSAADLAPRSSVGLSPAERKSVAAEHVKKSKALQYLVEGQNYPPERAAGWVQFGMWLVRPRAVREFRGHAEKLAPIEPYWMETVKAVDRVYANETLTEFWRHGKLVANTAHEHPYSVDVAERYQKLNRWYALDTSLDPPRPWNLKTKLPVFSLALVQGEPGARRWLLYAHAPAESRSAVEITIPDHGKVTVAVPRGGAFYLVNERDGRVRRIADT